MKRRRFLTEGGNRLQHVEIHRVIIAKTNRFHPIISTVLPTNERRNNRIMKRPLVNSMVVLLLDHPDGRDGLSDNLETAIGHPLILKTWDVIQLFLQIVFVINLITRVK